MSDQEPTKPRRGRPPKLGALSAKERAAAYRDRQAAAVERQLLLYRAAIREIDKLSNPLSDQRVGVTQADSPATALTYMESRVSAIIRQLDAWLLMAGTPRGGEMGLIQPHLDLAYADDLQLGEDRRKAVKAWKEAEAARSSSKARADKSP
ncbi:hypothetical protein [Mesorhizobium sp. Root157]|uniref:hypothetical protein n=1 Tax=Mesorhizobium sp. Root157 TaxID=1736477 RepID=UPI000AB7AF22|nr:hypothetical protein [Mesorhizobium sp. Root157]